MNKILTIAVVLFFISSLISCSDDDDDKVSGFSIDKDEITIGAEGGSDLITVSSGVGWTASASVPWITISPANGVGSAECSIVIDTTLVVGMREATVTFLPVGLPQQEISVYQTGYGNIISLEETELTIPASAAYDDRYFELKVTSNVEFKVGIEYSEPADGSEVTEWLTAPNVDLTLDRGARPRTTTLRFDWKINTKWEERGAKIVFTPTGKDEGAELVEEAVLTLNQEPALEITDDRAGDSLAIISIREQLNMLGSQDINEKLQNLCLIHI
ncbi:MAG: BACON domain-containing protein, partial [Prevotella sp.]|nr:BACON domain-containing protein [Prevotella sp.]